MGRFGVLRRGRRAEFAEGKHLTPPSRSHVRAVALPLGLAALTAAVFWPCLRNGFVAYDDPLYVTANGAVRAGLSRWSVAWAFSTFLGGNWHPLAWLSHLADVQFHELDPVGHHLTSVLFHAANAALVLCLLRMLTGQWWRSAAAAALFALHPLRVESVAWVSERKDLLCAFFGLLALICWVRQARGRRRWVWYGAAVLCAALSLMSKPMLVTLPALLLLLDFWPLDRARGSGRPARSAARTWALLAAEKAPFLALSIVSAAIALKAQAAAGAVGSLVSYPVLARVANALVSSVAYLADAVWPVRLAAFYPHPGLGTPVWKVAACAAILAALTALAWAARRRQPWALDGWLWTLTALAPVAGIVQVGTQARADRYTYVPLLGLTIAAVWLAADAAGRLPRPRRLLTGVAVAALSALAALSVRQIGFWRDSATLFGRAAEVTGRNWFAEYGLGVALRQRGDVAGSAEHFARALAYNPNHAGAHDELGVVLALQGRTADAEAHFREALRLDPASAEAWNNLGFTLLGSGRLDEAEAALSQALRLDPGYAQARRNLELARARRNGPRGTRARGRPPG